MGHPFTDARIDAIRDLMTGVGRAELLPRFHAQTQNVVFEKTSAFDVCSEADQAAEAAITAGLARLFPGAFLVGEEVTGHDPQAIAKLADADVAFLIDPIDGTKNFTSGLPLFGIMVAGLHQGKIVFAAIHDPICGDTSIALRGAGAWVHRGDGAQVALHVAPPRAPAQMHIVAGTNFLPPDLRPVVLANLPKFGMNFWLRCAAHEYRLAASGHCDLLVYNKLMPWDHAAGWLLHHEAGGYSAHFDGSAYLPTNTTGGLLCASDRDSWQAARDALFAE